MDPANAASAAKAVRSLLGNAAVDRQIAAPPKARGANVPNAKLSDFAKLVGTPTAQAPESGVVDLLKQMLGLQVIPNSDPQQSQLIAAVDEALSDTLRRILHHPDFQSLESLWRSLELLLRRLDRDIQIVLVDITAEELAADLSSVQDLSQSGLYQLLVEQPQLDQNHGPFTAFVSNFTFDLSPPHADLLGRIAKLAAAAHAPFLAAVTHDCLHRIAPEDQHPATVQAWQSLRQLPEAGYLGLTVPRFMLRWPYGKKTDPIEAFNFEEFTRQSGVRGMLWGNGAFLAGLLLGETIHQQGLKKLELGSIMTVDDLPFYYYVDQHQDQVALPCTDRLLSQRLAEYVQKQNFVPLLAMKGRPEVRLGGWQSLSGEKLRGPWGPRLDIKTGATEPAPMPSPAAAAPAVTPTPTAETAPSADSELDALLAGLDGPSADNASSAGENPAEPTAADSQGDELDALLAGLDAPAGPAPSDGMDPELAALLGDL